MNLETILQLTESDLRVLCDIAQAAGREIMAVYRTDFTAWEKSDSSPLTEADLRADAVIREGLQQQFPGVAIWSEESQLDAAQDPQAFFLVDPLDGTREFLKRNDEFTVNIAFIEHGEPVAGVVLAPALDELFYAARGLGAWSRIGGTLSRLRVVPPAQPLRVIGSRSHGGEALAAWLARLARDHSFVAAGSSLKFCRIAQGQADIYPRIGPTSQWDTAAAQAVLEEAGGVVVDPRRQRLRYGRQRPVLNPNFVAVGDATMDYCSLE